MIRLSSCPKGYSQDQDKAIAPEVTVQRVKETLANLSISVLARTERIDVGRLGIPVFLSICGNDATTIMPTRKQMGKGVSLAQAEASAIMELMERYGFFTYFHLLTNAYYATWDEAVTKYGPNLMPLQEVIKACNDTISEEDARTIMNVRKWCFVPALHVTTNTFAYVPIDLFKQLGEFNGSSAGNTDVESILQGSAELIERHVCAIVDKTHPELPTISLESAMQVDATLAKLIKAFTDNNITLILKDFSHGMPLPTVGALAIDFSTFPNTSEIVFTAGTATTPTKAAIRAITEVAQLAGDFCTSACYEASGLEKFATWEETEWLRKGPEVSIDTLPTIENNDMLIELNTLTTQLTGMDYSLYSISTTNPDTKVPTHYNLIPGLQFRERDNNASLGLFVGRILAEQEDKYIALQGLAVLETIYPSGHFIPFFKGIVALKEEDMPVAQQWFSVSTPLQPDNDAKAIAEFYQGYCFTLEQNWLGALPHLEAAVTLCPDMKEYRNLRGVCLFKMEQYEKAAEDFSYILQYLDKGSIMDIQNLGLCYKFMGKLEQAIRYLSEALKLAPHLESAQQHLHDILDA